MLPLGRRVICNYDMIYYLGYKKFSCFTQLSTKFIMLINVKMPTMVGILTFVSMINTRPESLKARKVLIFSAFWFCEQLKIRAQLIEHEKSFITSEQLFRHFNYIVDRWCFV